MMILCSRKRGFMSKKQDVWSRPICRTASIEKAVRYLLSYRVRRKAPDFRHGDKRRFVRSTKRVDFGTVHETLTS